MEEPGDHAHSDLRLRRLFETHRLAVLAYCMRRAARWDAHDAAAEVFVVAWRRIDDIPDGDAALPWLYGVARRVLANIHRSERRRHRLYNRLASKTDAGVEQTELQVVRRAEDQRVLDAASQLPEADREVLFLSAWEGLSHREVAEVLGMSETASRKRLERARRRLEKELNRTVQGARAAESGGL
ncbi:MAG: sigma-70 family RNA polymerase sigma factor [Actinomycetota bacterium]|nr:sigma-70 family RNA polymerase sigma factor [Actinomycetota bacterium]